MKGSKVESILLMNRGERVFDLENGSKLKKLSTCEVKPKEAEKLLKMYGNEIVIASEFKKVSACKECKMKALEISRLKEEILLSGRDEKYPEEKEDEIEVKVEKEDAKKPVGRPVGRPAGNRK